MLLLLSYYHASLTYALAACSLASSLYAETAEGSNYYLQISHQDQYITIFEFVKTVVILF